jgi:hypothetical protein
MASSIKIFVSYSRKDKLLREKLQIYLEGLERQGCFKLWHDRDINAGTIWEQEIHHHLDSAHIILLLISQHFMNSDYCYSVEMKRAMERHERGEAIVIPIILRPVYWQDAPFGKLQALPVGGVPVNSDKWRNLDEAFFDVTEGIRKVVKELTVKLSADTSAASIQKQLFQIMQPLQTTLPEQMADISNPSTPNYRQLKTGSKIHHSYFGEGVILGSEVYQGTQCVFVQFQNNQGKKQLNIPIAQLESYGG